MPNIIIPLTLGLFEPYARHTQTIANQLNQITGDKVYSLDTNRPLKKSVDEITICAHTDFNGKRLGAKTPQELANELRTFLGKHQSELKHVYLFSSEAGFKVNGQEAFAQAFAREMEAAGFTTEIHAIAPPIDSHAHSIRLGIKVPDASHTTMKAPVVQAVVYQEKPVIHSTEPDINKEIMLKILHATDYKEALRRPENTFTATGAKIELNYDTTLAISLLREKIAVIKDKFATDEEKRKELLNTITAHIAFLEKADPKSTAEDILHKLKLKYDEEFPGYWRNRRFNEKRSTYVEYVTSSIMGDKTTTGDFIQIASKVTKRGEHPHRDLTPPIHTASTNTSRRNSTETKHQPSPTGMPRVSSREQLPTTILDLPVAKGSPKSEIKTRGVTPVPVAEATTPTSSNSPASVEHEHQPNASSPKREITDNANNKKEQTASKSKETPTPIKEQFIFENFTQLKTNFYQNLALLKSKGDELHKESITDTFNKKGKEAAYMKAHALHSKLTTLADAFFNKREGFDPEKECTFAVVRQFKSDCEKAISESSEELCKHRGFKQIFKNLLTALIFPVAIYNKVKYGAFFPRAETNSAKLLTNIERGIPIPPPILDSAPDTTLSHR